MSTDERCNRCGYPKSDHELPGINVCSQFLSSVPEPKIVRTELQREADSIDCDLYGLISRLERLADRIKVAGPDLRRAAMELAGGRHFVRKYMHLYDRTRTS